MTDAEYQLWIESPAEANNKTLLIVIAAYGGSVLLSSQPYHDDSLGFDDLLTKLPNFEQSIDGVKAGSFRAIDALNEWDSLKFRGRTWVAYYGSREWSFSDFKKIAGGSIADAKPYSGNEWSFTLSGYSGELVNDVVSENEVLILGFARNVKPVLLDSTTASGLKYHASVDSINYLQVFDKGSSIPSANIISDYPNGEFTLTDAPQGIVTINAMDNGTLQLSDAIDYLAQKAGYSVPTYTGISSAQKNYYIGMAVYPGTSYISAIQDIASSIGARLIRDYDDNLHIVKLGGSGPVMTITDDHIINGTVRYISTLSGLDSVSMGWKRNCHVMSEHDLSESALSDVEFFTKLETTEADNAGNNNANGNQYESEHISTPFYYQSSALTELSNFSAARRNDRRVYSFKMGDDAALLTEGDGLTLESDSIPYSSGSIQRIIRFSDELLSTIEVLEDY